MIQHKFLDVLLLPNSATPQYALVIAAILLIYSIQNRKKSWLSIEDKSNRVRVFRNRKSITYCTQSFLRGNCSYRVPDFWIT